MPTKGRSTKTSGDRDWAAWRSGMRLSGISGRKYTYVRILLEEPKYQSGCGVKGMQEIPNSSGSDVR